MKNQLIMSVDVESVGLHGDGFAVGWVVYDTSKPAAGALTHSICSDLVLPDDQETADWLTDNIPLDERGALRSISGLRTETKCMKKLTMRNDFWKAWLAVRAAGHTREDVDARMLVDCGWPVEARFLAACVDDAPDERGWEGPYPLVDLGSVLVAMGLDPLATHERYPDESPAHHPTADAMQSLRIYCEVMGFPAPRVQRLGSFVG